jgi:tRNA(Arg) A34 adenosine deaminase TadA
MNENYAAKVRQQIERLRNDPYRKIEVEVSLKRLTWFAAHYGGQTVAPTPRRAFEMLFFEYMGLAEDEVPVVEESNEAITWLSVNPCPTLDACTELGLDTRQICRAAYEKSTQAFISQIDPQLRFTRSYEEIRPYARHCRESIIRVDFEAMMRLAIAEAEQSRREGNKGYGAVVVYAGQVVGKAHDTAATENDPSLHAEVNAIRQAAKTLGYGNLCGALLFSTCEPCPMCASLAVWANVTSIIYGVSIEETAQMGKARILIGARQVVEKSPVMVEVIGDVMGEACRALYA